MQQESLKLNFSSNSQHFGAIEPRFKRLKDGTLEVSSMPIFRTGTFRDSYGDQHTMERMHIDQIVANFNALVANGVFPDPPVRCDHPGFIGNVMRDVIGYVSSLETVDATNPVGGATETYILATFTVLDPEAANAIEKKLWRNRSSEIGRFRTNSEAEYYPVLTGFAYVDIPAVEGLNFSKIETRSDKFRGSVCEIMEEEVVEENPQGTPSRPAVPAVPASPFVFNLGGDRTSSDFAAVQSFINETLASNASLTTQVADLEAFQRETVTANRKNFVSSLVSGNKILASQQTGMEDFVAGMTPEQFGQFEKMYEGTPALPLFSPNPVTQPDEPNKNKPDPKVEAAKRQYGRLKIGGMRPDALAATSQAKILTAAGVDLDAITAADTL